jgi:radical SAM protein with 4Fe4S-binding SPASM domain
MKDATALDAAAPAERRAGPLPSDVFCLLPWTTLNVQADGKVFPCCAARNERPVGNARESSLLEIWRSAGLRRLRRDMLEGTPPPECAGCHEIERAGARSLRREANREWETYANLVAGDKEADAPTFLEVECSNICNFQCRYCNHRKSTAWYGLHRRLWGPPDEPAVVLSPTVPRTDLSRQIRELAPRLRGIRFIGGEPLLSEEHYDVLRFLLDQDLTGVALSYTTNFSTDRYRDLDVFRAWSRFRDVNVSASVDAPGKRGEYIRKGQDWDALVRNRERLGRVCPNVRFLLTATVTAMNALHLPALHRDWLEKGYLRPGDLRLGLLLEPPEYRVQILPADFKRRIESEYANHADYLRSAFGAESAGDVAQFEGAAGFMGARDGADLLEAFRKRTRDLDHAHGEKFEAVFPELAFLMNGAVRG